MARPVEQRAAGYIRVSQVGGREGESFLSPELQREKIEAWATYRDYRIVQWYIDLDRSGRSGSTRPEFERLMKDAREGCFEAVAVYRLTRFGRSVADAARHYATLRECDVALVSVTEDIDTSTASGGFMQNVLFAMAEFESQRIAEEWRNVHALRRSRGIAHVVRPMFGYRIGDGTITEIEEAEAPAVRTMFALRTGGAGYGTIRTQLAEEGFRTKTGMPRFQQRTISGMLANPHYAGLVRLANGDLIEALHPPIISREIWEKVQALRERTNSLNRHRSGLLSGMLICSSCDYPMHLERGRVKNGYMTADSYRCSAKARSRACARPLSIHAEYTDEWIEKTFLRRFDPRRMPNRGRIKATRQQAAWQRRAATLRRRAAELNTALDSLADQRHVKGTLTREEYERQASRYMHDRSEAQEKAEELERMCAVVHPLDRDVLSLWPNLPIIDKQRAFRILIFEIRVKPATRKGSGQRALIGQRLEIGWLG